MQPGGNVIVRRVEGKDILFSVLITKEATRVWLREVTALAPARPSETRGSPREEE